MIRELIKLFGRLMAAAMMLAVIIGGLGLGLMIFLLPVIFIVWLLW